MKLTVALGLVVAVSLSFTSDARASENCVAHRYQEKNGKTNVVKACIDSEGNKSLHWQVSLLSPHSKGATALSAFAMYNIPPIMTNGELVITNTDAAFRPFDSSQSERAFTLKPSHVELKKLGKDDYAIAFLQPSELKGRYILLLPNDPDGSPCTHCKGNGDWFEKKNSAQVHGEIDAMAQAMASFEATYNSVAAKADSAGTTPSQ